MKTKLLISILFLFCFFISHGQDTTRIIQITPHELSQINGIIEEFEWTKEENRLLKEKLSIDSIRLVQKDEEIKTIELRESKKEAYYTDRVSNLLTENDKLKLKNEKYKKRFYWGVGVSGAVGLAIGLLTSLLR
jgi:DNA gyrase/topoisomerase IV subunit A